MRLRSRSPLAEPSPRAPRAALLALLLAAGCRDSSPRIAELQLQDLQTPAMVRETAMGLKRPHLIELPPRPVNDRFDLELSGTTLRRALRAMEKLDPRFRIEDRDDVVVMFPSDAKDLEASPFSKPAREGVAEGGAAEVLRLLLADAGLLDTTNLVVEREGLRRPVRVEARGRALRDAFADVAAQAHLAILIEPGTVQVAAVPE